MNLFHPIVVDIGPFVLEKIFQYCQCIFCHVILEKTMKMWKVYRQTTNNRLSEKITSAFRWTKNLGKITSRQTYDNKDALSKASVHKCLLFEQYLCRSFIFSKDKHSRLPALLNAALMIKYLQNFKVCQSTIPPWKLKYMNKNVMTDLQTMA